MEVQRVQDISSSSLLTEAIPLEFIRSEKEHPAITTFRGPTPAIPVVDLSDPDSESVKRAVVKASEEWGIFQVVNHGIPTELIRRLQDVGRKFFELPSSEKESVAKPEDSKDIEGYGTKLQKDLEGKKAWVDHLFHRIWPPSCINYRFWPKNPPEYREVNEEYAVHMKKLSETLLGILSEGLGLKREALHEGLGGETAEYMMKINYYPPCPRPDLALGVPAHTDLSGITLLVPNEVPGLQVFKDDHWFDAEYIPSAVIVHIGDQILRLSNGKYKNVLHRTTVDKEKTRMSWPVFLEPHREMIVGPLPELTGDDNPPKFKPCAFKDYSYRKLNNIIHFRFVLRDYNPTLVKDVCYRPPGTQLNILNGVNFSLREKSFGLIFGKSGSGSGKTTLLQLLAGLNKPTSGSICIQRYGDDGQPKAVPELLPTEKVGIVFQFPERFFVADNVLDEITFGWPRQKGSLQLKEHLTSNLQRAFNWVGLDSIPLDKDPQLLSGGYKRRLALAIQLVQTPDLLILDEPLAGLDWKARADVAKLLKHLKKELTLLVVSHDLRELTALVDQSWRMETGGVLLAERPPL